MDNHRQKATGECLLVANYYISLQHIATIRLQLS